MAKLRHECKRRKISSRAFLFFFPLTLVAFCLIIFRTSNNHTSDVVRLEVRFRDALATFTPPKTQNVEKPPRALLIRENVGLRWNMSPEIYLERVILHELEAQGKRIITVLDIGANVGQFAIPLAKLGHSVISMEPNPVTCASLKHNCEVNGVLSKVNVHCIAAGDKNGNVSFQSSDASTSFQQSRENILEHQKEHTVNIPVRRVDELVSSSTDVFMFKTDTQGFELDVLKGATTILEGNSVFLLTVEFSYYLLKRAGTSPLELLNFVYDLGYTCTYMAIHTKLLESSGHHPYDMLEYSPRNNGNTVTFEDFLDSLRIVDTPGAEGVSGWSDLLCLKL